MSKQTIAHLLLTCLLLAAYAHYHSFVIIMVQARESDNPELGTKGLKSQAAAAHASSTWVTKIKHEIEANKARKVPSGPSPIGNRHPPDKP